MRGPWSSLRQEGSTPGVAETDPSVEVTFTGLGEGVNRHFLSVWAQHGSVSRRNSVYLTQHFHPNAETLLQHHVTV